MSRKGDEALNREMAADPWTTPQRALMERHHWDGGYLCSCGAEMNSPQTWSAHVLEEAWSRFTAIGAEGGTLAQRLRVEDALEQSHRQGEWKTREAVKAALASDEAVGR